MSSFILSRRCHRNPIRTRVAKTNIYYIFFQRSEINLRNRQERAYPFIEISAIRGERVRIRTAVFYSTRAFHQAILKSASVCLCDYEQGSLLRSDWKHLSLSLDTIRIVINQLIHTSILIVFLLHLLLFHAS